MIKIIRDRVLHFNIINMIKSTNVIKVECILIERFKYYAYTRIMK